MLTRDTDWTVYVRDNNRNAVAQLDDFESLTCVERNLGLGEWELRASFDAPGIDRLVTTPGAGIMVQDNAGTVIFAGPLMEGERRVENSGESDQITVKGWDDTTALHARLVHPEPLTATPPFTTAAYDVQAAAPASTVLWNYINRNAGPGAQAVRQWPGLTMAPDPVDGPTIGPVSGRWQNLLEFVSSIAGPAGMSVLVRQRGLNIVVTVRENANRNVELSPVAGTLVSWTQSWQAPTMTAGWAGDAGEGTTRHIAQDSVVPPPVFPYRMEKFVDHRNSAELGEVSQKLAEEIVAGAMKESLTIVPTDSAAMRYLREFDLGDRVKVVLDGQESFQVVNSATITFSADQGVTREFTVGSEQLTGLSKMFSTLRSFGARIRNLEGI